MNAPVREGEILAGKYRVDRVLGVGGMGVVVAAHHLQLDERVALKFLLPDALGNQEAVARFAREAKAAVKIKSEHVARVSDVGTLENGAPYIVMEYLDGSDLSTWLSQRGALPVEQAVEFILQASEALAEAHALGIVHRDLKPANIFVIRRPDGALSVKVLDFGISKMTSLTGSGGDSSMTKTSALMGSPLYMSPEQMQSSKNVDARGDIWALGVILYELVAGVGPFGGETMPELILQIMSAAPPPIRNFRPDAPDGLEAVILHCLEKDRGKRTATVGELAVALLPFAPKRSKASVERISGIMRASGFSGSALALPPSSDGTSRAAPGATAASWGRTTTGKSRGPWMIVGGVGLVAAIGATVLSLRKPAVTEPAAISAATGASAASAAPVEPPTAPVAAATEPSAHAPSIDVTPSVSANAPVAPIAPAAPISKDIAKASSPKHAPSPSVAITPPPSTKAAPATPKHTKTTDEWGAGRL